MSRGNVVIELKEVVHGVPYRDVELNSNMLNGCKDVNKSHWHPLGDYFLGNILEIFSKEFFKKSLKIFKLFLNYFVKVCVKTLPKICHFQSFQVHLCGLLLLKSSGYKSFYTIFEGPNVNEIIS